MKKDKIILELEAIVEGCKAVKKENINKEVNTFAQIIIKDCNELIRKIKREYLEAVK